MKYSNENLPPIGLIFNDTGGTYEIMMIIRDKIILNEIDSRKEYDYPLFGGIGHLNNGNWKIITKPIFDYEIY
jgi:hypothetical protein